MYYSPYPTMYAAGPQQFAPAGAYMPQPLQPIQAEQISMGHRMNSGMMGALKGAIGAGSFALGFTPLSPFMRGLSAGGAAAKAAGGLMTGGGLMAGAAAALPWMAAGYAATKAVNYGLRQMGQGANLQAGMSSYLMQNYRYRSGRTMGIGDTSQITKQLYGMAESLGTSVGEVAGLLGKFNSMGLMRAANSVRQFSSQFKRLVHTSRQIADELGVNLSQAANVMAGFKQTGFRRLSDITTAMPMINRARWATGANINQVMQMQQAGAQLGHAIGAQRWQGAMGAMRSMVTVGNATQNEVLNPAAIEEAMGISGPQARMQFAQLTQRVLARKLMSRFGRYYLAASATDDIRDLNPLRMQAVLSGVYTMKDIKKAARDRIYGESGRGINASDRLLMHEEDMRGRILEQGPLALASMMRLEMGSKIWRAEDWRVNRDVRRKYGVNKRQAELLLEMSRKMPELVETQLKEEERREAMQRVAPNIALTGAVKRYVTLWADKKIRHPLQKMGVVAEAWAEQKMAEMTGKMDQELRQKLGLKYNKIREPNILTAGQGAIIMDLMRRDKFRPISVPQAVQASPLEKMMAGTAGAGTLYNISGFGSAREMDRVLGSSEVAKAWKSIIYSPAAVKSRGTLITALYAAPHLAEKSPALQKLLAGKTEVQKRAIIRSLGTRYGYGMLGGKRSMLERWIGTGVGEWSAANGYEPTEKELAAAGKLLSEDYYEKREQIGLGSETGGKPSEEPPFSKSPVPGLGVDKESEEYKKEKAEYEKKVFGEYVKAGKKAINSDEAKWAAANQKLAPLLVRAGQGDKDAIQELGFQLEQISRHGEGVDKEMAEKFRDNLYTNPTMLKILGQKAASDARTKWVEKVGKRISKWRVSPEARRVFKQVGLEGFAEEARSPETFMSAMFGAGSKLWDMSKEDRAKFLAVLNQGGKAAQPVASYIRGVQQEVRVWEQYNKRGAITSRAGIAEALGTMGIKDAGSVLRERDNRKLLSKAVKEHDEEAAKKLTEKMHLTGEQKKLVQQMLVGGVSKEEIKKAGDWLGKKLHLTGMTDWKDTYAKFTDTKKFFGTLPGIHSQLVQQTTYLKKIAEDGIRVNEKGSKGGKEENGASS